jgi:acyl transferase domain-containing protein/acyl carrier protein
MSADTAPLSPLKRALLAIDDLQARLAAAEQARHEPIAIVGMGCRFPGGANDPDAFFRMLLDGGDGISEVPRDRWDVDAFYDPDPHAPGKMSTRWGGFLDNVDRFDPAFFGISAKEAAAMDPQQRLLLEVAWTALDDAGYTMEGLAGSSTGVWVGVCASDYLGRQLAGGAPVDAYTTTGNAHSIVANRLSFHFDLRGPSMTVDTACSSSLVAVHLACQSLRAGECRTALAGGVNVIVTPTGAVSFSRWGMMAPDGRCKTFDARANGFVRGEGCGVVVLKRLRDALSDGDAIWAVVRGTSMNQDGRTTVLTAPNVLAQQAVVRSALRDAGIAPHEIGYVEAHGTGTSLGDPMEVEALSTVVGAPHAGGTECVLGSVKTNIGHLEAAAGIAGLIKAALVVHHGRIPANLHFRTLNPNIRLDGTRLILATEARPWPAGATRRLAGVSSFGFGGTNAHVVVEAPADSPAHLPEARGADDAARAHLIPLSAHSESALRSLAAAWRRAFDEGGILAGTALDDLACTASLRRSHHAHRLALVARSGNQLATHLDGFLRGDEGEGRSAAVRTRGGPSRLVFVYSGQGAQWPGMACDLLQDEPVFRAAFEQCDEHFRQLGAPSLRDSLLADADRSRLADTEVAQPVSFAVQTALTALLRDWGFSPSAVIGHSVGEVAAAHAAGALSLGDAVRIVFHRGRLMQRATDAGRMAQVELGEEEARAFVAPFAERLTIGAINGPRATVLSGDPAALDEALGQLAARGISARRLDVRYAFHSAQMTPFASELQVELRGLTPTDASVPFFSTVNPGIVAGRTLRADYWVRNVVEPVRFSAGVTALLAEGDANIVELGGHPVLLRPLLEILAAAGRQGTILSSLRRGRPGRADLLHTAGALYTRGYSPAWDRLAPTSGRCTRLPAYRFDGARYWLDLPEENAAKPVAPIASIRAEASWFHEVQWQPIPAPPLSAAVAGRCYIVLTDASGVGEALAAGLKTMGARCVSARPGAAWNATADGTFTVASDRVEDFERLLRHASDTTQLPLGGIVHLWSLDGPSAGSEPAPSELNAAVHELCVGACALVRALATTGAATAITWVTRGAQPATNGPVAIAQAPLWGLVRVAALEQPAAYRALVDLDPAAPGGEVAMLLALLNAPGDEDQIALRGETYLAARLERRAEPPVTPPTLRPDGTYLITGGLGDLGLQIAGRLAQQGARHLLLFGRHGLPPRYEWPSLPADDGARRTIEAIAHIEALGATVEIAAADVGDLARMTEIVGTLRSGLHPLRGIVHAAGVSCPAPVATVGAEEIAAVFRAKVNGASHLHALTRDLPLDFFVGMASVSGVWGSSELGAYAAANHFLDALAHDRRAHGLTASSIAWGPWDSDGMAADDARSRLASVGVRSLPPAGALDALDRLLGNHAPIVVADIDWARFKPVYQARRVRHFFDRIVTTAVQSADAPSPLRHRLDEAHPLERQELLAAHIGVEVSRALGADLSVPIDRDRGFFEMGMDSLTAVQLTHGLEAALGRPLPATVAFDHPSVTQLAAWLMHELFNTTTEVTRAHDRSGAPDLGDTLARVEQLSDDEALALVAEKLKRRMKPR